jgi:hypothetical protein
MNRDLNLAAMHDPCTKEAPMAIMCSLAVCKAQAGMCGHEKVMFSIVALAAIGLVSYLLIS